MAMLQIGDLPPNTKRLKQANLPEEAMFLRSYRLSQEVLGELLDAGMDKTAVETLRARIDDTVYKKQPFLERLNSVGPVQLKPEEKKLVTKLSQLSLLRLEWFIPNRGIREWADALVFAVLIAVLVRSFVVAPFKIPSGSMEPTIAVGDHIFASMYSYGLTVPFTDIRLFPQSVERGDIIIFPYPGDKSIDYIKRVVAVEGDTVELRGTQMYLNGKAVGEPHAYYNPQMLETYRLQGQEPPGYPPFTVPKGRLFMMGDNRFNSADSRVWGPLDASTVKGKAQFIYWSHDPREGWFGGYRLGRVFQSLD